MSATPALTVRVCGVGLVAPGILDWATGVQVLAGRQPWQFAPLVIPATEFLPPAERRRAGKAIRLALGCAHQAIQNSGRSADGVASVFASTDVDAENTHQICMALNESEPSLSPTRFHNSVQNAVSGYWTILTASQAPTTMVMGGDGILAMGLLEAMIQAVQGARPVLLVVFDLPMPAPLFAAHPIEEGSAIALVLDAHAGEGPAMSARLLPKADGESGDIAPDGVAGLHGVHPLGPALPMLALLAREEAGHRCPGGESGAPGTDRNHVRLDFDRYHSLQVVIEP